MRVHRPTAADIERERLIVSDRRYGADRPVIIDMLRRLRAASTPPDFYDLHLELFRRFKTRQDGIGALKKERSGHQSRRRELAAQVPRDVSAITAAQRDADAVEHAMEVEEALLSLLRVIGDGIAWRAMGYDRAAFGILGTGARVGRLAADEGLDPEIEQIDHYSGEGVFAIHNDLTGCLLHGDVTAIYPEWIEVVEVKRGRVDPNSAQMVRLRDAIELINKRRHTFEDGTVRDIVDLPKPYKSRLGHLRGMLAAAREEGYAAKQLSRCQWCAVASNRLGADQVAGVREAYERSMQALDWGREGAQAFRYNSAFRRMRDRRQSFSSVAPISIYPLDVEDVADLMLGYFDVYTMLNTDILRSQFAERGIDVEIAVGDEADDRFLVARRRVGDRELLVHAGVSLREQLLMELEARERHCGSQGRAKRSRGRTRP